MKDVCEYLWQIRRSSMFNLVLFVGQIGSLILGLINLFENALAVAMVLIMFVYVLEALKTDKPMLKN